MKAGEPVTVTLNSGNFTSPPLFRQYEVINFNGGLNYSMIREDAKMGVAGSCTVSLRTLNTHKWKWVAKIQIRIFKRLLQEPKPKQP